MGRLGDLSELPLVMRVMILAATAVPSGRTSHSVGTVACLLLSLAAVMAMFCILNIYFVYLKSRATETEGETERELIFLNGSRPGRSQ